MINDLLLKKEIDKIKNGEAAKAATESSGEAFVEYAMDITFIANPITHTVKLTAYPTTCQLMIQPKGEQSGAKPHLGSRGTPRYFTETILIPWCEQAVESKAFDDKLSSAYITAIKEEIKRLDISKFETKKYPRLAKVLQRLVTSNDKDVSIKVSILTTNLPSGLAQNAEI